MAAHVNGTCVCVCVCEFGQTVNDCRCNYEPVTAAFLTLHRPQALDATLSLVFLLVSC